MRPLVSILIPAYNAERWIRETLRSALAQTWPNKEIIVVDDGSTDRTLKVVRDFEASGGVKVIAQKNRGAAAARNAGYAESRGEYIQWLDADDLLAPDKIELQMMRAADFKDPSVLLSGAWAPFSHRPHAAHFQPSELWADLSPSDWLRSKLGKNLHMQTATWLTTRALAEAAGPWNTSMWVDDDGEYFCRVLLQSRGVVFVPGAKVYYRMTDQHRLSVIGLSDRKKDAMLGSIRAHVAALRSLEESDRVRVACLQYLQNWFGVFYPERPDIVRAVEQLAAELGGTLKTPSLSWKYSWIKAVMGWRAAKRAQLFMPHLKARILNGWDSLVFSVEKYSGASA